MKSEILTNTPVRESTRQEQLLKEKTKSNKSKPKKILLRSFKKETDDIKVKKKTYSKEKADEK